MRTHLGASVLLWTCFLAFGCGPHSGTGASDSSGTSTSGEGSTGGPQCPESDLPPPFCHRRVPGYAGIAFVPAPPPGWQPLITSNDADPLHALLLNTATLENIAEADVSDYVTGIEPTFPDIDGDGIPEIALRSVDEDLPFYSLPNLEFLGSIPYVEPDPYFWWGSLQGPLDVDHDGDDEIFLSPGLESAYEIWGYEAEQWVLIDTSPNWPDGLSGNPLTASRADIDGDGFSELVLSGDSDPNLVVLYGAPGATLPEARPFLAGYPFLHPRIGDFDGDGSDDILVGGASSVAVSFGDGDGNLSAPVSMDLAGGEINGSVDLFPMGDFDGSGRTKLLAPLKTGDPSGRYLLGFSPDGIELTLVWRDLDISTTNQASDINHDGVTDFLATDNDGGGQRVFYVSITP